jgi:hypothetical protein
VLDTNKEGNPKLIEAEVVLEGLETTVYQLFSVVPYFDAAPWGGQWMKEVYHLDPVAQNYGWCFNCVPEENSLLLKFGEDIIENPSINTYSVIRSNCWAILFMLVSAASFPSGSIFWIL